LFTASVATVDVVVEVARNFTAEVIDNLSPATRHRLNNIEEWNKLTDVNKKWIRKELHKCVSGKFIDV
jgi:hypothetical protein